MPRVERLRHQQEALKRRGFRIGDVTERDGRVRLVKAKAEQAELELAQARRELIPAQAVEERWTHIAATIKADDGCRNQSGAVNPE